MWRRSSLRRAGPSARLARGLDRGEPVAVGEEVESAVSSSTRRCSFSSFATTLSSHQAWETSVWRGRARSRSGLRRRLRSSCSGSVRQPAAVSTRGSATARSGESPEWDYPRSRSTDRHGHTHPRRDRPRPHQGADRARGGAARRAHAGLAGVLRAGAEEPRRRRRLVVPVARSVADLPLAREGRAASGTSTATSTSTSTTASARWCRATRTTRSRRR